MARWLALSLLLINVAAYWGWHAQREVRLRPPPPEAPAPSAAVPQLVLLREVADSSSWPDADADADAQRVVTTAANGAAALTECLRLGAPSPAVVRDWQAALAAAQISVADTVVPRVRQELSAHQVWVIDDRGPAVVLAALAQAGIEGLMLEGPDGESRMSAGTFRVRDNAFRQQQRLRVLGFTAEVVPLFREQTTFWVEITGPRGLRQRAEAVLVTRTPKTERTWQPCTEPPPALLGDGQE